MVTQPQARELIARAVVDDTRMPDDLDVILQEPDGAGSDAAKTLPLLLVTFDDTTDPNVTNSDFTGYKTNDDGEQVATVFESQWDATARLELWTAAGSSYNVNQLGERLHEVLYQYDSSSVDKHFTDSGGNTVESLWNFVLQERGREDDLTQTPTVRRYQQFADVYGTRYYVEDDQTPVRTVDQETDPNGATQ